MLDMHVIIDSPELHTQAHVLISDPCPETLPIRSKFVKQPDEVKSLLDEIEAQWQMRSCWSSGSPTRAA